MISWLASRPTYVSMGTQGRSYIKFADGKSEWVGPEEMSGSLHESSSSSVVSVAFGGEVEDYAIVWDCGDCTYSGVPKDVHSFIRSNGHERVQSLSLGPNGSYWLEMSHHTWWSGSAQFIKDMKKIERRGGTAKFVDFGANNTHIIRYSYDHNEGSWDN